MNPEAIKEFLLFCLAFNYAILLVWFAVFSFAHDRLFRFHFQCFKISSENFDMLHYASMTLYKVGILLFNIAPLVALWLVF
ncbi:MAG: hypothetical protein NTX38_04955 [Methylobacter sp.]|nr:hypothetical protein [Methylobacter sp.]